MQTRRGDVAGSSRSDSRLIFFFFIKLNNWEEGGGKKKNPYYVSTVVKFSEIVQIEQAGAIDRDNVEVERVLFDGLDADLVGLMDIVFRVRVFSLDTQKIYVILLVEDLKQFFWPVGFWSLLYFDARFFCLVSAVQQNRARSDPLLLEA